jgi:hypothetical protein
MEMTVERISQPRGLESGRSQEWYLQVARGVQRAAEVANCVVEGVGEISRINEAIAIGDKEQMWNLLQQSIAKYRHLICLFFPITKIRVITVSKEDLTIADLRSQLEVIAKFVLVYEGLNCGCKIAFKEEVAQVIEKLT